MREIGRLHSSRRILDSSRRILSFNKTSQHTKNTMSKVRESNLELLRIVAMFFIVLHHLIAHGMRNVGYLAYPLEEICLDKQIPLILLNAFTVVAVNCYVLISGYFGINPTWKKLWNLFAICAFYSVGHYLVYALLNDTFNIKTFVYSFLPFSHNQGLWFVTCYIGLFLISPLLNASVSYLNEKKESEWLKVLGGLAIITFYFGYLWRTELNHNGYSIENFIFLYMIGRYLNLKNTACQKKCKSSYLLISYFVCTFITASLGIFFLLCKGTSDYLYYWAWRYNSPFVILGAVSLFMFFNSLTIRRTWINYIAASTFSVYLIHENVHVNMLIYDYVYEFSSDMNVVALILYLVIVAIVVFIGCIIVDILRRKLFDVFIKKS